MIPYGRQDINQADIDAVMAVLKSDWLTQGPMVPRFERALADKVGAQYAVAVNSATSALHIACLALDLGPGDWLWTSPNTFVASANCALYCGARVDFVDIDPRTYNMSVDALKEKLHQAERSGHLPKIVIPVHFAGQSCEMAEIKQLASQYDFKIIEDAAHAVGGRYKNKPIGSGDYSDITVFSFHPVKLMTTGEGGMAVTNNIELAEKMSQLRTHGITRCPKQMKHHRDEPWYYEQLSLGFNYRMTDIQAVLGLSQLGRLDDFVQQRQRLASFYDESFIGLPLVRPFVHQDCDSAFHLYVVQLDPKRTLINRKDLFQCLRTADIGANVHYIPVHTQPYYQNLGFSEGDFPAAERYYQHALSLPIFARLSEQEQRYVINKLSVILNE
jgi:UDP-4-amino-4,6-dideoxy-N-acetyl-beta-L-altrosamine transaminase